MKRIEKNGRVRKVATGFSWKYLLFGCLYPLAREDYKGALNCLIWTLVTGGFALFVIPFTHNKKHLDRKIDEGWQVLSS